MTKKELTHIVKMFTGLATYFRQEIPEPIFEIYLDFLKGHTYEDVQEAIRNFFETGETMPLIADFRQYFISKGNDPTALGEIKWSLLLKIIEKCGLYISWTDKDPAFRRAVESVGYETLCNASLSEMKWLKKDFIKIYTSFAGMLAGSYEAKKYFVGSHEADNYYYKELPRSSRAVYTGDRVLFIEEGEIHLIPHDEIHRFLGIPQPKDVNTHIE